MPRYIIEPRLSTDGYPWGGNPVMVYDIFENHTNIYYYDAKPVSTLNTYAQALQWIKNADHLWDTYEKEKAAHS